RKMAECGLSPDHVETAGWDTPVEAGPFAVSFLHVTHSIPDPAMLLIETPAGRVLHTGDFKLDEAPLIGVPTNMARLRQIGDEGLLALVCDSTNIFEPGRAGGEGPLRAPLEQLVRETKGAVAATTFASNVARLKTLAETAQACDRSIVVAGRAMRRMIELSVETGAIDGFPSVVSEDIAKSMPAEHLFYLVTGSQGEGRAAVARIASETHPTVTLGPGDRVLFSSKTIPGNEEPIYRLYNQLSALGVDVIDSDDAPIHVSGHACHDEIKELHELVRPQLVVPMHGEHRHLVEHARLSHDWGERAALAPNGTMIDLRDGSRVGEVETGRAYLDGEVLVGALDGVIRQRLKIARSGHVSVSLAVDEEGELFADPMVTVLGGPIYAGGDAPLEEMIANRLDGALHGASRRERRSDDALVELAERVTRKVCNDNWGKKPVVTAHVIRLEAE
ncbi:MAG: ribonuclease J, partial [Pseudomonadota bacterium]